MLMLAMHQSRRHVSFLRSSLEPLSTKLRLISLPRTPKSRLVPGVSQLLREVGIEPANLALWVFQRYKTTIDRYVSRVYVMVPVENVDSRRIRGQSGQRLVAKEPSHRP